MTRPIRAITRIADDDYTQPLQLLARSLRFIDPMTGADRVFDSRLSLAIDRAAATVSP